MVLLLLSSSFSWAVTTKEKIKGSIQSLSSILPAGLYKAQAFKRNLFGKVVPWDGNFCEVHVSHNKSQPQYESYSIGAFVIEKADRGLKVHANMSIGLLAVESQTTLQITKSDTQINFIVSYQEWETSTLIMTENSFYLKNDQAKFRIRTDGEVHCGKLIPVAE